MNKNEQVNFLIKELIKEKKELDSIKIPSSFDEKRKLFRALMNIRSPGTISKKFIEIQNNFLSEEAKVKGIVELSAIAEYPNLKKISLWKGDITTLKVDGIVNAANSQMLGCFIPNHSCIDNAIHSSAGIQLREECNNITKKQGFLEPVGLAKITKSYNLPCKYVLHTVGPNITEYLTEKNCLELASSYKSCFNLATMKNLESLAFCCVSTGEYGFPKEIAAKIATSTIIDLLKTPNSFKRIIFNVFTDEDYEIYSKILSKYE